MRVTFVSPSASMPIGGVTAIYEFPNGLARRGHEVHLVHLEMWGRRVRSMADLDRFRFEPEIVHYLPDADPTSLPDTDVVFGTGAPDRLGLPVLLLQGVDMLHPHLEDQAFGTPCLKVCVASWLAEVALAQGVPAEQLCVVPCGIDHDAYRLTRPLDQRPMQVGMLYSSHVAKGWDVGLRALQDVHRRVPEVRAQVFGTAVPSEELPDWIKFHLNPPPQLLLTEIYNQSRVFLQSSDYEGFGLTAVEAMACGAALVTTDNGGSTDYARHKDTARVVPPRDASGLADHTVALLTDDVERRQLAERGRRSVVRFDWDRSAALLERHLFDYLAEPERFRQPYPNNGERLRTALDKTQPR